MEMGGYWGNRGVGVVGRSIDVCIVDDLSATRGRTRTRARTSAKTRAQTRASSSASTRKLHAHHDNTRGGYRRDFILFIIVLLLLHFLLLQFDDGCY